jgi:hypothetical protein
MRRLAPHWHASNCISDKQSIAHHYVCHEGIGQEVDERQVCVTLACRSEPLQHLLQYSKRLGLIAFTELTPHGSILHLSVGACQRDWTMRLPCGLWPHSFLQLDKPNVCSGLKPVPGGSLHCTVVTQLSVMLLTGHRGDPVPGWISRCE